MNKLYQLSSAMLLISGLYTSSSLAADKLAVTEENYETAESDFSFNSVVGVVGTNKWMFESDLLTSSYE